MTPWRTVELICRALDNRLAESDLVELVSHRQRFMQMAGEHLVTPALIGMVEDPRWRARLPDDLIEAVTLIHDLNRERNDTCLGEIAALAVTLNRIGVEPILLKGAAALVDGLYPDPGWRMLVDIDVLVPADRVADCAALLESEGWKMDEWARYFRIGNDLEAKDYPRLSRDEFRFGIELHRHLTLPHDQHLLRAGDVFAHSSALHLGKAQVRLPSPSHRLMHNLINSQRNDRHHAHGTVSIRQLFEWVRLRRRDDDRIDWNRVIRDLGGAEAALRGYCALAAALFDQPPHEALDPRPDPSGYVHRVRSNIQHPIRTRLIGMLRIPGLKLERVVRDPSKLLRLTTLFWWRSKFERWGSRQEG